MTFCGFWRSTLGGKLCTKSCRKKLKIKMCKSLQHMRRTSVRRCTATAGATWPVPAAQSWRASATSTATPTPTATRTRRAMCTGCRSIITSSRWWFCPVGVRWILSSSRSFRIPRAAPQEVISGLIIVQWKLDLVQHTRDGQFTAFFTRGKIYILNKI